MNYYDQLIDFLNAHRFLVLPGVGTIVVTRTNSRFSKNRTILRAPKFHLELLEVDTSRFQQQISILAKSWDIEEQKVGEVLEEFVPSLASESGSRDRINIPGIGNLFRIEGDFKLQSSGDLEKKLHYMNADVPLHKPFKLRKSNVSEKPAIKESKFLVMTRTMRYAAASLLIFSIVLIGVGVAPKAKSLLQPVKYTLEGTDYNAQDFNRAPETDGSERNTDLILDSSAFESIESSEENKTLDSQSEVQNPVIKRILTFSAEDYPLPKSGKNCTYIAGSFTSAKLASRMKSRLEAEGFEIYESPYKVYTRIGVVLPCEADSQLHELAKIESKYWLLKEN